MKHAEEQSAFKRRHLLGGRGNATSGTSTTDLVGAQQDPAEVPGLLGGLGPGQPRLGCVLPLHVRVEVQLVEGLEGGAELVLVRVGV